MYANEEKNVTRNGAESATGTAETMNNGATPAEAKNATGSAKSANTGVYTHVFKKPFEHEGRSYTELEFNFERLTGRDMLAIENEMQAMSEYALAPEISASFQCKLAAKAAGIGSDVLEALPLKDFNKITGAARGFLLDSGY